MRQAFAVAVLLNLGCMACATADRSLAVSLRRDAHKALDEAHRLQEEGRYAEAVPHAERALALTEANPWKNDPEMATCLDMLGNLHLLLGDLERAEWRFLDALARRKEAYSDDHPLRTPSLYNLARLRLAQHRFVAALQLFEKAFAISERYLGQETFGFSEARLANVLHHLRNEEEFFYALASLYPDDSRVRQLALSAALLRKGRSVAELASTSHIIYRGLLGLEDQETIDRLRSLRTRFAMLSFAGPGGLTPAEYQKHLAELVKQGELLEAKLAERSAPLRKRYALPLPSQIIHRVRTALPAESALIEFIAYHVPPLASMPGIPPSQSPGELRYLALLLFQDGRTRAVDLGLAKQIDEAAQHLHQMLGSPSGGSSPEPAAKKLYELTFAPLVPLLGDTRRLFLSPDGQLTLIPFDALYDGSRFLVDVFDISYLTSGRDLLMRDGATALPRSVVALVDPDFGALPSEPSRSVDPSSHERSALLERLFSMLRSDSVDRPWVQLPGTREEGQAIQRLYPQTRLIMGAAASKTKLLKLPTPGILHIATHGFFLQDAPSPSTARAVAVDAGSGFLQQRPPDPLLRSGLVLAGARAAGPPQLEDSLVTALELAGMNLWGTQLVVLSACETGRGDVRIGQGVFGLRRALVVAGAETLVTSLWKVDDNATRELMEGYYGHLLAGKGRAAALRVAMQELRQKRPDPHFWAPFIAIGRDEPLHELYKPASEK